jgi:hypothetical protein
MQEIRSTVIGIQLITAMLELYSKKRKTETPAKKEAIQILLELKQKTEGFPNK